MSWTLLRLAAVLALVALFDSRPAHALQDQEDSFTFSQSGYSEGATVTGAFAGVDLPMIIAILQKFNLARGDGP